MKIHWLVLVVLMASLPAAVADPESPGFELHEYPELVQVPDYPVYYAPAVGANYFFYDGDFWMFQEDNWYRSPWYDGPWERITPEAVPDDLLQVPVRYYVQPPAYFFTWWYEEGPHWGEHWGHEWERRRHGWERREHRLHHKPAPLPDYQRDYSGQRYPRHVELQQQLQGKFYPYRSLAPAEQTHREQVLPAVQIQPRTGRSMEANGEAQQGTSQRQNAAPTTRALQQQRGDKELQNVLRETGLPGRPAEQAHGQVPPSMQREQTQQGREDRRPENGAAHESGRWQERERER